MPELDRLTPSLHLLLAFEAARVVQTAMAGEGVAIGWRHIIDRLTEQNLLVRIGPWRWRSSAGFYFIWSRDTELSTDARTVRDWIIETAMPARRHGRQSQRIIG